MCFRGGQDRKIHAILRPMSHPRTPGSGKKMRRRKAAIPVPWPSFVAAQSDASGHGRLIATVDVIVAKRRDFSEDGSAINSSRA
jgi:hypothetical protein